MPGYRAHLIGGTCAFAIGLIALHNFHPSYSSLIEWLLCALAGSLFPDVDTKSKGQGIFYRIMLLTLVVALIQQQMQLFIALSIIGLMPLLVRHRGLFHQTWFIVCFPLSVGLALSMQFPSYTNILFIDVAFFIAGALSHLLLDLGVRRTLRW